MMDGYNAYPWMTIIPLLLVCLAAWLVTRLIAKRGQQFAKGKYAQIKDSLFIGKDKNIVIIEAGNKYYLVGVTNQSMQLLSEIEKGELVPVKGKTESAETPQSVRGALLKFVEQAKNMRNAPEELRKAQIAARQGDDEHGKIAYSAIEYEEETTNNNDEQATSVEPHDNKRLHFIPKAARRDDTRGGDSVTIIGTIPIPEEPENEFERQLYEAQKEFDDGGVYLDVSPATGITNTLSSEGGSKPIITEEATAVKKSLFLKRQKKEQPAQREEDEIDRMLLSIGQRTQMLREKRNKDKEEDID